jgi:precorrin-6A/cobalt-precorrin-6A reductase
VVDVTHPYATEVSRNARQVCQESAIHYRRYVRETSDREGTICVRSIEECAAFLKTISGSVFFTTGSKNIPDFQKVRGQNRFIYRVLPTPASLETCHQHHVAMKDIVAVLGPISEAFNIAMFQEYHAEYVVMKDSGKTGGTPQKLSACHKLGIISVLICRKDEEGISDLDVLAEMICRKS